MAVNLIAFKMLRWTLELDTVLCDSIVEIAASLHLSRDQVCSPRFPFRPEARRHVIQRRSKACSLSSVSVIGNAP
jgi:hypothetical protein